MSSAQLKRDTRTVDDILLEIISKSQQFASYSNKTASAPSPSQFQCSKTLPAVALPPPPAIMPALQKMRLRTEVAQEIGRLYDFRASELRQRTETALAHLFSDLAGSSHPRHPPSTSHQRIVNVFSHTYLRTLHTWINDVVVSVEKSAHLQPTTRRSNATFNHDYVPLLEHFFDENPFPSHADKVFLAKKSGMAYRQIHVWVSPG
ncbi:hypothetical protein PAXRUDRAFT_835224 [Paxillus rubicundulus Ve08.2h10]|uniref:Homeobox domain-containing protein n=1 Tax=Paxillus rubicundulus Ve08.2h10 TaxID=930991 RepID=A0A0D0C0J3_9AGAM|nr:hypothetical protein PAXRUDRAFT_835224 [Paxillus rubicundulus Ve08.2h10]